MPARRHVHHRCRARHQGAATLLPAQTRQLLVHHGQPPQENRPHEGIGYVTPDDEHEGRGDAIRQARRDGLTAADQARRDHRRAGRNDELSS